MDAERQHSKALRFNAVPSLCVHKSPCGCIGINASLSSEFENIYTPGMRLAREQKTGKHILG